MQKQIIIQYELETQTKAWTRFVCAFIIFSTDRVSISTDIEHVASSCVCALNAKSIYFRVL